MRFVTATNVDLKAAVDSGSFRSDLYYRLNVHRVHMPPLRERAGDVRAARRALPRARTGGRPAITGVAAPARAALLERTRYPGNVRQLEHIIQRAVAIAQPPGAGRSAICPEELLAPERSHPPASEGTVSAARERAEREMIVATLARCHGEISATARELQVSRTTMWRLMKKHGIEADDTGSALCRGRAFHA